jgi:hypothetical protein
MTNRRFPQDDHYSEPEIIPPDHAHASGPEAGRWPREIFVEPGTRRIYVTRIGPLGLLPFALVGSLVIIAALIFLFGFLLVLIPVAGVVLAAAAVASFLSGPRRWLR